MKNFTLYNYEFEKIHIQKSPKLFGDDNEIIDPDESFKNKHEIFEKILMDDYEQTRLSEVARDKTKLIAFTTISKKKLCIHTHLIKPTDNITVLKICNTKKLTHHQPNFTDIELEDYPGCLVIIDNRKDVQRIAVESNKKVFSGDFTLANILNSTFNDIMHKYSLDFRMTNVQNPQDFWEIVQDKINYPKGFKKVVFSLPPLNKEKVLEKYAELSKYMRRSFNSGMDTAFNAEKGGELRFSKEDEFQSEFVDYASIEVGGENTIILYPNGAHQKKIRVGKLSFQYYSLDQSVIDRMVKAFKDGDLISNAGLDKIKSEMKKGYKY